MSKSFTKKKLLLVIPITVLIAFVGIYVRVLTEKPEQVIEEYIYALNEKQYSKVYDYLDTKKDKLFNENRFIEKITFFDKNPKFDKPSYLSKIKKENVNKILIQEIHNPDFTIGKDKNIEYYSLSDIGNIYNRNKYDTKNFDNTTWKFYSIHIFIKSSDGEDIDIPTSIAVRKEDDLLSKYKIVDPCILKDIEIEIPKGAEIFIDGIKLDEFEVTDRDTDFYKLYGIFPGKYEILLKHENALKEFRGTIILTANPKDDGLIDLSSKLQFKKKQNTFQQRVGYIICKDVIMYEKKANTDNATNYFDKLTNVTVLDKEECEDKNRAVINVPSVEVVVDGKNIELKQGQYVQIEEESGGVSRCSVVINNEVKNVIIDKDKLNKTGIAIWYKVKTYEGRVGWIYGDYVKLRWE